MFSLDSSKRWAIYFYKEQLNKFEKLGMGKKPEFGVLITEKLIQCTKKRLSELSVVYDRSLTPQAHKLRQLQLEELSKNHTN